MCIVLQQEVLFIDQKCCVFPWQSFKTQSTLYKMLCALFGEDNGKQGRQFRLRLEYSNVELQCEYRIE